MVWLHHKQLLISVNYMSTFIASLYNLSLVWLEYILEEKFVTAFRVRFIVKGLFEYVRVALAHSYYFRLLVTTAGRNDPVAIIIIADLRRDNHVPLNM